MVESVRGSDLVGAFARLAVELHAAPGVDETVQAVVDFALPAVGCQHAGVTLTRPGEAAEIAAVTDPDVYRSLSWQLKIGDGPMRHALATATAVRVPDIAADDRWPQWHQLVADLAIGSVLHVPLVANKTAIGVLSLYHDKPHGFSDNEEAIAHILAQHASVALAAAREEAQLVQAVDARKLVGQAQGILMERHDLSSDQAFDLLRRYSQETNTRLRDVAQHVIDSRLED